MSIDYSTCGAVFDWDGVIIDSHNQHKLAWEDLLAETKHRVPDDFFQRSFGMRNEQIFPEFFEGIREDDHELIAELGFRKEELYRARVREDGIEPLPGVRDLLSLLADHGVPCSVGTSTPRANVEAVMEIAGLADSFQAISASEDVKVGKPDPEVFLIGAQRIDRQPENCVVFEDAFVGIEAGHRAGMRVIAVATTNPIEALDQADLAVPSLEGLRID